MLGHQGEGTSNFLPKPPRISCPSNPAKQQLLGTASLGTSLWRWLQPENQAAPQQPKGWAGSQTAPRLGIPLNIPHDPLEGPTSLWWHLVTRRATTMARQCWGSSQTYWKALVFPTGHDGELDAENDFCKTSFTNGRYSKPTAQPSSSKQLQLVCAACLEKQLENSLKSRQNSFATARAAPRAFSGEPGPSPQATQPCTLDFC